MGDEIELWMLAAADEIDREIVEAMKAGTFYSVRDIAKHIAKYRPQQRFKAGDRVRHAFWPTVVGRVAGPAERYRVLWDGWGEPQPVEETHLELETV